MRCGGGFWKESADAGGDNEGVSVEILRLDFTAVRREYMDALSVSEFGVFVVVDVRKERKCSMDSCRASVCSGVRPAVVTRKNIRINSSGDKWLRRAWQSSYHSGMLCSNLGCIREFSDVVEALADAFSGNMAGRHDSTVLTRRPASRRMPGDK